MHSSLGVIQREPLHCDIKAAQNKCSEQLSAQEMTYAGQLFVFASLFRRQFESNKLPIAFILVEVHMVCTRRFMVKK